MTKAPKTDDIQIGQNVRKTRLRVGMTQTELADALGMTFQQVQKYEKGANRIGGSRLAEIARALDVEIAVLFEDVECGGRASVPPATEGLAERLEMLMKPDRDLIDGIIDRLIVARMSEIGFPPAPMAAPAVPSARIAA